MNSRQKEMLQISLNDEKEILKKLEANYKDALDEITTRIAILKMREDADLQHVIYQIEYQKQLKSQIETILDQLKNNNFDSVSEYLTQCYEKGFIGTLYDIQGQGVPLVFPIDQEMVVAAIQHETKLSESLYMTLGKDTKDLSKKIASEISRGISNNAMYNDIARNLSSYAGISKNNAMRIARTEGHRIQNKAISNAQEKAKEKGADIVKIWDAALDGHTRPHHRELDGQVRELDEPFEIAGMKAMEPGGFGRPEEDINCRCRRISKARWLLGEEETKYIGNTEKMTDEQLEPIAEKLGISVETLRQHSDEIIPVKANNYEDFKMQYDKIYNYRNTEEYKAAQERIAGIEKGNGEDRVRSNVQKMNLDAPDIKNKLISKAYDDFNTVLLNSEGDEMMVNRIIMASDTVDFVEDNTLLHAFAYIPDEDIIKYNSNIKNFEMYDLNYVQAHELSHRVDMKEIESWKNPGFVGAIEKSRTIVEDNKETIIKWFEDGGKHANDVAMSDIISALSNGKLNDYLIAGHDEEYWNSNPMNVPIEIMANMSSIDIIGYDSKMELETMFKDLFDSYKVMVK